jgi:hypothetical protein
MKTLACFVCVTGILLQVVIAHAQIYSWTDKSGAIHFSDNPQSDKYRLYDKESSGTSSKENGPAKANPIFKNNWMKVVLVKEQPDLLAFDVELNNIQNIYPDITRIDTSLTVSTRKKGEVFTLLAYKLLPVRRGIIKGTSRIISSKSMKPGYKTDSIEIAIFHTDNNKHITKYLFRKEIPFPKKWGAITDSTLVKLKQMCTREGKDRGQTFFLGESDNVVYYLKFNNKSKHNRRFSTVDSVVTSINIMCDKREERLTFSCSDGTQWLERNSILPPFVIITVYNKACNEY